jgi:hypothetical protein
VFAPISIIHSLSSSKSWSENCFLCLLNSLLNRSRHNTLPTISYLLEWLCGWIFEMMRDLNHKIGWKLKKLIIWNWFEKVSKFLDLFEISKFKNSFLANQNLGSWNFDFMCFWARACLKFWKFEQCPKWFSKFKNY